MAKKVARNDHARGDDREEDEGSVAAHDEKLRVFGIRPTRALQESCRRIPHDPAVVAVTVVLAFFDDRRARLRRERGRARGETIGTLGSSERSVTAFDWSV